MAFAPVSALFCLSKKLFYPFWSLTRRVLNSATTVAATVFSRSIAAQTEIVVRMAVIVCHVKVHIAITYVVNTGGHIGAVVVIEIKRNDIVGDVPVAVLVKAVTAVAAIGAVVEKFLKSPE